MIKFDKGVTGRIEGATQPRKQFQGTETKERRCSDHKRRLKKPSILES